MRPILRWLLVDIDSPELRLFRSEAKLINLSRLRVFALIILAALPILALADGYRVTPQVRLMPGWSAYTAIKWLWIGSSLAYLLLAGRPGRTDPSPARAGALSRGYTWFILILSALHSGFVQVAAPINMAFIIAAITVSAFLVIRPVENLFQLAGSWLVVVWGVMAFQADDSLVLFQVLNSLFAVVLGALIGRVTYVAAATAHTDRRTIEGQRDELERLSQLDGLTGLANRRFFDDDLEREWRRAARSGRNLAAIMIDVDNFKLFNDTYGHQAGDDCLRAVAGCLAQTVSRGGDLVARYGGEEFVVLLPETGAEGAGALAERMRHRVAELCLEHAHGVGGVVTVSLGVAGGMARGGSAQELIAAADQALYQAKSEGRNRVVTAEAVNDRPTERAAGRAG